MKKADAERLGRRTDNLPAVQPNQKGLDAPLSQTAGHRWLSPIVVARPEVGELKVGDDGRRWNRKGPSDHPYKIRGSEIGSFPCTCNPERARLPALLKQAVNVAELQNAVSQFLSSSC
jgi:hypothetical protein